MPLYVTDRVSAIVFWALFAFWAGSEAVAAIRAPRAAGARNRDRGSRTVLIAGYWLAVLLAFGAALAVPAANIPWGRPALFWVGVAFAGGGLCLRRYAIATLGRLHTMVVTTRAGQPVVQAGPYRWIRHPSYAGAMLTAAGILLCSTNWLSLACYPLVAAVYGYRIRVEERALAQDLGDAYRDYMRHTKRLIPFLI